MEGEAGHRRHQEEVAEAAAEACQHLQGVAEDREAAEGEVLLRSLVAVVALGLLWEAEEERMRLVLPAPVSMSEEEAEAHSRLGPWAVQLEAREAPVYLWAVAAVLDL